MNGSYWTGSTDPEDKTGIATFCMCGHAVTVRMESFADFHKVCELLKAVNASGVREGAQIVTWAAQDAYNNVKDRP